GAQAASLHSSAASRRMRILQRILASSRNLQAGSLRSTDASQPLQHSQRHRCRSVLASPKRRSRGNQQIPARALAPAHARRDNHKPLPYLQWLGFLPAQEFPEPIARQFFDYATKSLSNLFQLTAVWTRNFRDRIPLSRFVNKRETLARKLP